MADTKISELLKKRESIGFNLFTLVLVAMLGVAGFWFWGQIVPFVLDVVFDTVKLAIGLGVLAAMGWVVADPKMRTNAIYMYASIARWITRQFVEIDPIGILKTFVARLKASLAEMVEAIGSLQGARNQLADFIKKKEAERVHELQRAAQAKKAMAEGGDNAAEMRGQLALSGRQAGRLEASNKTMTAVLARYDSLLANLKVLQRTSAVFCKDIENEVGVQTEQYTMITKGNAAFKRAQKMMATSGPERELYDETLNRLADTFNEKMGQIEYYMEASRSMIAGVELDDMAYEESALAQLEKWEKDSLAAPQVRVDAGPATGVRVEVPAGGAAEEESPDSFGSLFNDKSGQGKV
jgi:hypothetical protein